MREISEVNGVVCSTDDVKISLIGIPDRPGIASQIFKALGQKNINVDLILQNVARGKINDITFTSDSSDLNQAKIIINELQKDLRIEEVEFDSEIAVVSIIGAGIAINPGIAQRMFDALSEANINIKMISTSEVKISCLVDEDKAEKAVEVISNKFELEEINDR